MRTGANTGELWAMQGRKCGELKLDLDISFVKVVMAVTSAL